VRRDDDADMLVVDWIDQIGVEYKWAGKEVLRCGGVEEIKSWGGRELKYALFCLLSPATGGDGDLRSEWRRDGGKGSFRPSRIARRLSLYCNCAARCPWPPHLCPPTL
jgi:hypothetical protein